ncbi:MAG: septum formation initiator family protein [Rickettsiales bacterium]
MTRYAINPDFRQPIQKRAISSLFCVLILFYLAFHAVSGERGVFAMMRESSKLDAMKAELAEIKNKRESLEKKVQKLNPGSLDLDLLDEQSRHVLGRAGKGEVVIFLDEKAKK